MQVEVAPQRVVDRAEPEHRPPGVERGADGGQVRRRGLRRSGHQRDRGRGQVEAQRPEVVAAHAERGPPRRRGGDRLAHPARSASSSGSEAGAPRAGRAAAPRGRGVALRVAAGDRAHGVVLAGAGEVRGEHGDLPLHDGVGVSARPSGRVSGTSRVGTPTTL